MHGTVPSCGAPFGHTMLSGHLRAVLRRRDLAPRLRCSRDRPATPRRDRAARSSCRASPRSQRYQRAGRRERRVARRARPPRHGTGAAARDDRRQPAAFCGLPASENARISDGTAELVADVARAIADREHARTSLEKSVTIESLPSGDHDASRCASVRRRPRASSPCRAARPCATPATDRGRAPNPT